ncbi:hypothetical protein HYALB_00013049 [Hymenoscyphus albidus]|uniref:Uncharacterized protein n=1 Tax=Hymenoscyphus albidus TaxID=595503 RepID=A0A9N9M0L4_9HELO|nr:hypothetical protein HYALB_00013049 [Hymenoscyphus albidus]
MPQFTVEELRAAIGDPNKPEDVKRLGEFITSHDDTFAHGLAFLLNSLDEATLQQKLSLKREKLAQVTAITDQEESDKIIKELQDKLTEATSQLNTTPPAPAQTLATSHEFSKTHTATSLAKRKRMRRLYQTSRANDQQRNSSLTI